MKKTIPHIIGALLFLALLAGCLTHHPVPYTLPAESPDRWLDQWRAGLIAAAPPLLRGRGKIRLEEGGRPFHGEVRAIFDGRQRLYLEVSGFGFAGLFAAAEAGRVQVYDVKERTVYDSGEKALADPPFPFLGLRLTLSQLQRSLRGLPALSPDRYLFRRLQPESGGYLLVSTSPQGGAAEVSLIPQLGGLARERWYDATGKKAVFEAQFPEYLILEGRRYPKKIEWQLPPQGVSLRLLWQELEVLAEPPPGAFQLDLPPGVARRPLP